jgi:hypothetical protein
MPLIFAGTGPSMALASFGGNYYEGVGAVLLLAVLGIYALLVALLLLFNVFRWQAMVALNCIISTFLIFVILLTWKSFQWMVNELIRGFGGEMAVLFPLALLAVMLFIFAMPITQGRKAERQNRAAIGKVR